jgi:hypothetical protein
MPPRGAAYAPPVRHPRRGQGAPGGRQAARARAAARRRSSAPCPTHGRPAPGHTACLGRARGPGAASRPPGPYRVRRCEPSALCVPPRHCHGRFAQCLASTGECASGASKGWFVPRCRACGQERLTPGGETGGRDPPCACQQSKRFPTQPPEDDCGLLACRKPLGLLPPLLPPLSSRSASSWRGELYGEFLWIHLDTSSELLYPNRCPI